MLNSSNESREEITTTDERIVCEGCGEITIVHLCCPKCKELGRLSFFCCQQCFSNAWKVHSQVHAPLKSEKVIKKSFDYESNNEHYSWMQEDTSAKDAASMVTNSLSPVELREIEDINLSRRETSIGSSLNQSGNSSDSGSVRLKKHVKITYDNGGTFANEKVKLKEIGESVKTFLTPLVHTVIETGETIKNEALASIHAHKNTSKNFNSRILERTERQLDHCTSATSSNFIHSNSLLSNNTIAHEARERDSSNFRFHNSPGFSKNCEGLNSDNDLTKLAFTPKIHNATKSMFYKMFKRKLSKKGVIFVLLSIAISVVLFIITPIVFNFLPRTNYKFSTPTISINTNNNPVEDINKIVVGAQQDLNTKAIKSLRKTQSQITTDNKVSHDDDKQQKTQQGEAYHSPVQLEGSLMDQKKKTDVVITNSLKTEVPKNQEKIDIIVQGLRDILNTHLTEHQLLNDELCAFFKKQLLEKLEQA